MNRSNDNFIEKVTIIFTFIVTLSLLSACDVWPKPGSLIPTPKVTIIPSKQVTIIPTEVTMMTATPQPQVTIIPPTGGTIPEFVVTSDVLEVRSGPGENYPNVGYLSKGDTVAVIETAETSREVCQHWARIGVDRWVCAEYLRER